MVSKGEYVVEQFVRVQKRFLMDMFRALVWALGLYLTRRIHQSFEGSRVEAAALEARVVQEAVGHGYPRDEASWIDGGVQRGVEPSRR